jgi:hypothetical protein
MISSSSREDINMQGINKLNITWKDDNHAHVQDPDNGHEFNITVRPRKMWQGAHPVKPRLYVNGPQVRARTDFTLRQQTAWAKAYFGPTLSKILNKDVDMKFSSKAGCSCGCSPGFIINDVSVPFDIWMDAE